MPTRVRAVAIFLPVALMVAGCTEIGNVMASFDIQALPVFLAVLACVAIPALVYFGTIFTFAHQVSDYAELSRTAAIQRVKSFQAIAQVGDAEKAATSSRLYLSSDPISSFVRSKISRHSSYEYIFAGVMVSSLYLVVGLFVVVPWSPQQLDFLSSYGMVPFSAANSLGENDIKSIRAAMTPIFWAYCGAYFYALQSLVLRVNSRDATPGHFYAMTVRLVASILIALLVHHAFFGSADIRNSILPAVYFFCGLFPEAFQSRLWEIVKSLLKIPDKRAEQATLDDIDGLDEGHMERLQEIGVDSAYALAVCDPIRTFVRLPYRLSQVVDWIDQALLIFHFGQLNAQRLRSVGIRSILELAYFDPANMKLTVGVAPHAGMTVETLAAKWQSIIAGQPFIRLHELTKALAENEKPDLPVPAR